MSLLITQTDPCDWMWEANLAHKLTLCTLHADGAYISLAYLIDFRMTKLYLLPGKVWKR